jgi:uncharacterized protein YejL (UPF0352 family)
MKMRRLLACAVLGLSMQGAGAGPYSAELGRCLVSGTTPEDRVALARWIFIAFSGHPALAPMLNLKPADIDDANRQVGQLVTRLLTTSCREQTRNVIKFEGSNAFQASFETLGQVAGGELAASPGAQERMAGVAKYFDQEKLAAAMKDP